MLHVFPYSFLYKKHTDYQLQHLSSCVPYCKKLDDSHTFTVQCQIHSKLYSSFDTSVLNLWSPSRHPEEPALVQASEQPEVVLRWQPGLGHHYQLQLATEVAEYHVFPTSFPSFPLCTDPPQRLSAQLWHFGECFQACHPSRFDWVCSCALCVDCDCSMQLWNNPIYFGFQAGMSCAVKTYGCGHLDPKLGLPQKSKRDCRNCGLTWMNTSLQRRSTRWLWTDLPVMWLPRPCPFNKVISSATKVFSPPQSDLTLDGTPYWQVALTKCESTVVAVLFVLHLRNVITRERPSIPAWVTNPHLGVLLPKKEKCI